MTEIPFVVETDTTPGEATLQYEPSSCPATKLEISQRLRSASA